MCCVVRNRGRRNSRGAGAAAVFVGSRITAVILEDTGAKAVFGAEEADFPSAVFQSTESL